MPLDTALTRLLGIAIPIISAPIVGVAGGKLAVAVMGGSGLGLVGGNYPDPAVIEHTFWRSRQCRSPYRLCHLGTG